MELMHAEQTELLRRAFYDVHNEVGLGRQEEAYHQALKLWFADNSLPVASRPPHRLSLRGVEAHVLFPDFVGWDVPSVEIKAVPRKLNLSEWVQVRDYIRTRSRLETHPEVDVAPEAARYGQSNRHSNLSPTGRG